MTNGIGHLIDIMPTVLEASGSSYPRQYNNYPVLPMEGRSLVPVLRGGTRPDAPIFWEFNANRAVRLGRWKLVAERSQDWELYDIDSDRCELTSLIEAEPEVAAQLSRKYDEWAERAGARTHAECLARDPSSQTCYQHPATRQQLNRMQALGLKDEAPQQ